ncbi:MAG: PQQ-binding-like beta-propeller repeat protein [Planctomycetes bacterium]|nr:PQQ-binding-like beta-propeller repeat protein [Planctomycetota bacterium]
MSLRLHIRLVLGLFLVGFPSFGSLSRAEDWPMWRYDAGRTASTPQQLPDKLTLAWTTQLKPPAPAWPEDAKLLFDAAQEPVVWGKTLLVGLSAEDSLLALDVDSGREKWRFFAEGPVRMAPVVADGRVYFGSDDGVLYCLSAADGALLWKIPSPFGNRTAIGNDRLISLWPVRGGLVIDRNWLYYAAGVWPFEGAALFRVDLGKIPAISAGHAPSVEVVTSLTDDAPQGYLAISDDRLFVPSGRGPAVHMSLKGTPTRQPHFGADKRSDYLLSLHRNRLFHGQRVLDTEARKLIPLECSRPVIGGDVVYFVQHDEIVEIDLSKPTKAVATDRRGQPVSAYVPHWRVPTHRLGRHVPLVEGELIGVPVEIDLLAGRHLFGHWENLLFAIRISSGSDEARITWTTEVEGSPQSLIAADGKLFVSTREGRLLCFAGEVTEPKPSAVVVPQSVAKPATKQEAQSSPLLKVANAKAGYGVVFGAGDIESIEAILRQSELRLIVIDPAAEKVQALRERMVAAGRYGSHIAARVGNANSISLPPYLANFVWCKDPKYFGMENAQAIRTRILPILHPYGGTACLRLPAAAHKQLAEIIAADSTSGAKVELQDGYSKLYRPGALPGAADWTHEYGDAANSLMSQDKLVASPLGILWFGGPAADTSFFFDRHLWPPSPLVVGGRMYLQGVSTLAAVDIYTGRVLWRVVIEKGTSPGRRVNFDTRQHDIGYHMAAAEDAVYLCYAKSCLRIDPDTGKTLAKFTLPSKSDSWGEIQVVKNRLMVSVFDDEKQRGSIPMRIVALDRTTGQAVWSHTPVESCPLMATGGGRVYLYDGIIQELYADMKRKGKVPAGGVHRYLKALDAETGKVLWQEPIDMIATWLAHSADTDIVVTSNQQGMEARSAANGRSLWKKEAAAAGFKGHPESRMDRLIMWNDRIIDQRGPGLSYEVKTGKSIMRPHPITGDAIPWEFTTTSHHCGYAIASQNMLTFRDGTAGYSNVSDGMTTRLPGFRSGCRNSLIPAGGVLNAPNMAQGCNCGFSVFTSLALVHVPEVDSWSYSPLKPPSGRVERLGINLGAPGDRLAPDGTLWLDWPSHNQPDYVLPGVAGPSPDLPIEMEVDAPRWFSAPPRLMQGTGPAWVAASGVEGLRSLTIPLGGAGKEPTLYTVRLIFAEPDEKQSGERVFDVAIDGRQVLKQFDLNKERESRHKIVVREFSKISAKEALHIELKATAGRTLLCGVEIVAE